jgi:hypothetical protein
MRLRVLLSVLLLACFASAPAAFAQLAGTVYLDFGGGDSPLGNLNAIDTSIFPGLNNTTDKTAVKNKILSRVQSDYNAFSLNITDVLPAGDHITVIIGNKPGDTSTLFGVANSIDWRNKVFADPAAEASVGISLEAHANINTAKYSDNTNYSTTELGNVLANTVSHEIAHTLGLVHGDTVSTYASTAGTAAQKQTAVQSKELMTKNPNNTNFYSQGTLSFGAYSALKLNVAAHGIELENESGAHSLSSPGSVDPIARTGDTGKTLATATPLHVGADGYVSVLGNLAATGANTIDYYAFHGVAGETIFGEVLSQRLVADPDQGDIPGADSLINDPISPRLRLLNSVGAILQSNDYPDTNSNFDGSGNDNVEGDALIYNFTLPATGTYYWTVNDLDNAGGDYELFTVPEPASATILLLLAAALAMPRRMARC